MRASLPESVIPVVQSAPVSMVTQSDLPPLAQQPLASSTVIPPVRRKPPPNIQPLPSDPSITELIETGERLTLEQSSSNFSPVSHPIPVAKQPRIVSTSTTTFIWPIRGRIVSGFGTKPGGLRNDGINIAAAEGTPIQAIADGKVLYTNNAMKGYGNLLLIRHNNGWISTYSHNKTIKVKQGDIVKQGDTVAYVGKTGNVASPQLHLSLRKDKKPVNPTKYLATTLAQGK